VLAAITVFIIDREFNKAAAFAASGAILSFFGFIHGEAIGIGRSPAVAVSYLVIAIILIACERFAEVAPHPVEAVHGTAAEPAE
jgi:AGZA family xanthine/uracil permease-like MFS transporter